MAQDSITLTSQTVTTGQAAELAAQPGQVPLFVDLDGTLIRTDMLYESFLALLRTKPLLCLLVPFWLLRGKAYLKHRISQQVDIAADTIPFHQPLLDYLRGESASGRPLILATATSEKPARAIAAHLGIFSQVIASNAERNISGHNKLEQITAVAGGQPFDYAANAMIDVAIWRQARKALLVSPERGVERAARKVTEIDRIFPDNGSGLLDYLRAMRTYQWMKNLLLFVPLLTAHKFNSIPLVTSEILAFFAFSLCSSGVYVLNDLLDLPADRAHPRKRSRPFAAGDLPLAHGLALALLSPAAGLVIAYLLSPEFCAILLLYMLITFAYSIRLKAYAIVDVIILATLYTIRVFAGAVVIGVTLSFWLLTFSMFLFLSLALVKRCSELVMMSSTSGKVAKGRGYHVDDIGYLQMMGIASGYLAILVVALYIDSPVVTAQYSRPQLLWLLCPTLLFWISRVWLKTGRGEMHDDPLIFTIRDTGSRLVGLICVLTVFLSI